MDEIKKITLLATGSIAFLIVILSMILVINLASMDVPKPPKLRIGTTIAEQDVKTKEIANYKELISALQTQRTNIFDYVVLQALLPLFTSLITAVLAYIFAKTGLQIYNNYLVDRNKTR